MTTGTGSKIAALLTDIANLKTSDANQNTQIGTINVEITAIQAKDIAQDTSITNLQGQIDLITGLDSTQ